MTPLSAPIPLDSGPAPRNAFRRALAAWYRKNGRDLPWRRTRDPYAILVSELMLQQTQVTTVLPYYSEWLRRFPTVAALAAASESDVLHTWQGLGYYARARNLHAAAKAIVHEHSGHFPENAEVLRRLPGVGRYTANAVASFAFNAAVPIVEANTARLFARLLDLRTRIDSGAGRDRLWSLADTLIPARGSRLHNSALMDLGALICVAGEPRCGACPVRSFCCAEIPATLPVKAARASLKLLTEDHELSLEDGKIWLEQSRGRWRGMWTLPRIPARPEPARLLYSADFPFTHHHITLRVHEPSPAPATSNHGRRCFTIEQLDTIPMPSPHRRALNALLQGGNERWTFGPGR